MRPLRRLGVAFVLGIAALEAGPPGPYAAPVERVFPLAPPDAAIVGRRTHFELGYETLGEQLDTSELLFRITLHPLRLNGARYEFDQRADPGGWILGDENRVLHRPRLPLADGLYRWTASFWNGVAWSPESPAIEIRIDSVPPADVSGLRLARGADGLVLDWDPVTLDRDGRSEYVRGYHVYRYERGPLPPAVRAHEIGVVERPPFVDRKPIDSGATVLFYRITAEDEAGNEPDRRD